MDKDNSLKNMEDLKKSLSKEQKEYLVFLITEKINIQRFIIEMLNIHQN